MLKKQVFVLIALCFFVLPLFSQQTYKAMFHKAKSGFPKGDTIEVLRACKYEENGQEWHQLLVKTSTSFKRCKVKSEHITFFNQPQSFWGKKYFWEKEVPPYYVNQSRWPYAPHPQYKQVVRHLQQRVFKDEILEIFLEKMLAEMYTPEELVFFPKKPGIKIINHHQPISFCYTDGVIYLSTGLLVQVYSENELYGILATELAHLMFGHTNGQALGEYNQAYLRFRYSLEQSILAEATAAELMTNHGRDSEALGNFLNRLRRIHFFLPMEVNRTQPNHALFLVLNYPYLPKRLLALGYDFFHDVNSDQPDPYLDLKMVQVLELHAFKMFENDYYLMSLSAVSRIIRLEIAEPKDYLLKMKLIKKLCPDENCHSQALEQLRLAKELNTKIEHSLYEEEIHLLIRLDRVADAISVLDDLDHTIKESNTPETYNDISRWSKDMRKRLSHAQKEKEFLQTKDQQTKG